MSNSWFKWFKPILTTILILLLTGCSAANPPTEFAPDGEVVENAILLQLSQTEQRLSQQLNASYPQLEISQIQVKKLDPVFIADLAAYHLQGTYNLKLILPRQEVMQKNNPFDIYLQRQIEGKTWRLLKREVISGKKTQWKSYLVRS
jgi:hypothetical protein